MTDLKPRTGKPPLGLLPARGVAAAAAGLEHGARKYWPNNWRDCPPDESFLYVHAMLRHAHKIADGEWIDPDSGLPHIALMLAGGMILAELRGFEYQPLEHDPRINSWDALFGPRPPHPADVKADADAYARRFTDEDKAAAAAVIADADARAVPRRDPDASPRPSCLCPSASSPPSEHAPIYCPRHDRWS